MKKLILLSFFTISISSFAQVGINTTSPNAQLDIKSSNQASPNNTDGLLIPKIDAFPATNPTALQQGMLVYLTSIYGANQPGFYSWDNVSVSWLPFGGSTTSNGWSVTGNTGTIDGTNFIGTIDDVPINFRIKNKKAGRIEGATTFNTFLGYQSGNVNTGSYNSGFGFNSLKFNTTGSYNVAFGYQSLFFNTTGSLNTALGYNALYDNTTGTRNVATGLGALQYNTTGSDNVAMGNYALGENISGNDNTALGINSLSSNTTGFSNVAFGKNALQQNTTGVYNHAFGDGTLVNNITGSGNIAMGTNALASNTTGTNNTAIGTGALYSNTTVSELTAIGNNALVSNTTGYNNTAVGSGSLLSNTSGLWNTSIGGNALLNNTSGLENTAVGVKSLQDNTFGEGNTAVGVKSLDSNINGRGNVGIGAGALRSNKYGVYNVGIGTTTGDSNQNGSYNTFLGFGARPFSDNFNNATAIGHGATTTASDQVRLGNYLVTSISGYTGWTNISDKRFKKDIQQNVPGLSFIKKLKPVTYHLDMDAIAGLLKTPDSLRKKESELLKGKILQTGFIAQEVEAAAKELNYDFSGVDAPKNENDFYGLRYAEFVVPLVKAVQELEEQNTLLKSEIEKLKLNNKVLSSLLQEVAELKKNASKQNIK
jgi:trimeric autotransporter adhesin